MVVGTNKLVVLFTYGSECINYLWEACTGELLHTMLPWDHEHSRAPGISHTAGNSKHTPTLHADHEHSHAPERLRTAAKISHNSRHSLTPLTMSTHMHREYLVQHNTDLAQHQALTHTMVFFNNDHSHAQEISRTAGHLPACCVGCRGALLSGSSLTCSEPSVAFASDSCSRSCLGSCAPVVHGPEGEGVELQVTLALNHVSVPVLQLCMDLKVKE